MADKPAKRWEGEPGELEEREARVADLAARYSVVYEGLVHWGDEPRAEFAFRQAEAFMALRDRRHRAARAQDREGIE